MLMVTSAKYRVRFLQSLLAIKMRPCSGKSSKFYVSMCPSLWMEE